MQNLFWYVGLNLSAVGEKKSQYSKGFQFKSRETLNRLLIRQESNSSTSVTGRSTSSGVLKVIIHYSQDENYVFIPLQLK